MNVYLFKIPSKSNYDIKFLNDKDIEYLNIFYKNTKLKKYYGLLLQKFVIKQKFNIKTSDIYIRRNKNGKPYYSNLNYNLSYTENFIIIAYSNQEVGIDIEHEKEGIENIIKEYCDPILIGNNNISRNTNIWTKIESHLKLIGTGLLDIYNIYIDQNSNLINKNSNLNYYYYEIPNLPTKIEGTICTYDRLDDISFEEINLKNLLYILNH